MINFMNHILNDADPTLMGRTKKPQRYSFSVETLINRLQTTNNESKSHSWCQLAFAESSPSLFPAFAWVCVCVCDDNTTFEIIREIFLTIKTGWRGRKRESVRYLLFIFCAEIKLIQNYKQSLQRAFSYYFSGFCSPKKVIIATSFKCIRYESVSYSRGKMNECKKD